MAQPLASGPTGDYEPELKLPAEDGHVYLHSSVEFERLRQGYNKRLDRKPAMIVSAKTAHGVQLALEHAREYGRKVSVRSGGHSCELLGVLDDAIVIDFSTYMTEIKFDETEMTATMQPGATWGSFYTSAPTGLGAPGGSCPGVGVCGLTLGGGANDLSTLLGYSLDNVISFSVVLADGRIVEAKADHHPDLFWALRGAGHGGFGVVTSITIKLSKIEPKFISARLLFNESDFERALNAIAGYAESMPKEVNLYFCARKMKDTLGITLHFFYNGPPEDGELQLQEINTKVTPKSHVAFEQSYAETVMQGPAPQGARLWVKGGFLKELSGAAIAAMRQALTGASTTTSLNLYWHGGAMRSPDRHETAFVHRSHSWNLVWHCSEQCIGRMAGIMSEFMSGEIYNNYPDLTLEDWQKAYYCENYERLCRIKAEYDPKELFKGPQTIAPIADSSSATSASTP